MPKIIIHHPDGESVKFGLQGKVFTIGRAENNDIVLRDGASSSYHAVLKITDCGDFAVTDLESTNHTKVNGQHVSNMTLMNGDVIQFGDTQAIYESDVPIEGRHRVDEQPTQIYEMPPPPPAAPRQPVFVNQPPRAPAAGAPAAAAGAAPAGPAQPYVIQRPVSTISRRGGQGDGCFAIFFIALAVPFAFLMGMMARHTSDAAKDEKPKSFIAFVKDYFYGEPE
jgi:pSer/pThr/pTyr-binding forkhead associated (FHA) protein